MFVHCIQACQPANPVMRTASIADEKKMNRGEIWAGKGYAVIKTEPRLSRRVPMTSSGPLTAYIRHLGQDDIEEVKAQTSTGD